MKMHLESSSKNLISHYGEGILSVNHQSYSSNILVLPDRVIEDWLVGDISNLKMENFNAIFSSDTASTPEIVLLGTGNTHQFPDFKLLAEINARGVSLEVMTTQAACRTYGVLVSEHRAVAAALIQIKP